MAMTQFSTTESGLFSEGDYNAETQTLVVTFRNNGYTYEVSGVPASEGQNFMTSAGKSGLWQQYRQRAVRR